MVNIMSNREDWIDRELVDKYYRTKFTCDLSNYFVVNGRVPMARFECKVVTDKSMVEHLYQRTSYTFDGDPAIYLGAGPWWNIYQNFEFSGMFAYLFIAERCIRKECGNGDALRFSKKFSWPLFNDVQPAEAFDIIAVLKEASLAPFRAEAASYISMLDNVIPYMREITRDFLSQLPSSVEAEIDNHIQYLYDWVRNTRDEELYLFGKLRVCKEYMPEGSKYPARYYLLESMRRLFDKYGIYSFGEIEKSDIPEMRSNLSSAYINSFDGPVTPHYSDMEFMGEYNSRVPENPFACDELSEKEKKENMLYNVLLNLWWHDERFEKDGLYGLKDCWGRIIVPAEFEDAEGLHSSRFITKKEPCVAVKLHGYWALTDRSDYRRHRTDYKFDGTELHFNGTYLGNYILFDPAPRI